MINYSESRILPPVAMVSFSGKQIIQLFAKPAIGRSPEKGSGVSKSSGQPNSKTNKWCMQLEYTLKSPAGLDPERDH
jgi:hypothetical protein